MRRQSLTRAAILTASLRNQIHETAARFKIRMEHTAGHMNSSDFAARDGTGLLGLAKELRPRCEALIKALGERLPK